MRDTLQLRELIEVATGKLSDLVALLTEAHDELTHAEEAWDELLDQVAETLTQEYREAARKSDPAEHTVLSATRREHRSAYQRLRRAKRQVDLYEKVASNRRAELSGYQSELGVEKVVFEAESRHQPGSQGPQGGPIGTMRRAG